MQNKIYNYLAEKDIYLDEEDLESLSRLVINEWKESFNRGLFYERTEFNEREKTFSDEWKKQNEIKSFVNHGKGLLQDLMFDHNQKMLHRITENDRVIVATVIQWLGSNIGFNFLETVLNKCGYKIEKVC